MAPINAYHRPTNLEDALALLARPDVDTAPLAGGTVINGLHAGTHDELVDLQALDLGGINPEGSSLVVGATVTLDELTNHEIVPPMLQDLARREAPNTIRNAATVGGTIGAADPESGLLAGLLAYAAVVTIASTTRSIDLSLGDLLADRSTLASGLITSVRFTAGGAAAAEGTARTPADTPIVQIVGRRSDDGNIRLAATGVAPIPIILDLDHIADLDPPPDFRGTAEYRRHLAQVLSARVTARLGSGGAP